MGQQRSMPSAAQAGVAIERNMTVLDGCRLYPVAICWSIILSLTIVMEAYDRSLIFNFYAFPAFQKTYGQRIHTNATGSSEKYAITPAWQQGISGAVSGAGIVGLLLHGFLADRLGNRIILILALAWMSLGTFAAFFALNIETILVYNLVCGRQNIPSVDGR